MMKMMDSEKVMQMIEISVACKDSYLSQSVKNEKIQTDKS